jgi:hypothetical protein
VPDAPVLPRESMQESTMRICVLPILVLASVSLHAQAPANASVHALCDEHANALFGALEEAHYDTATADFDAALRARYPATKLKQDYEALPATYGKLIGRGRPHTGDMSGHAVVMAPLIFERGTLTAEVHCNADGSVTDFRLEPTQVMGK